MTRHPQFPRAEWLARRARILGCAASLVHDDEGRIMLLHTSWGDAWQLPGGGHDDGEDLWETSVRETFEETGLTMPDVPELLAVDWGVHPEGIPEVFVLFKGPLVDASTVKVRLSDEHDAWRMLTVEEWAPLVPPRQARVLAAATAVLLGGRCPYLREAGHLADVP
ncbi:NUDIX hydrolase [Streptomyces mobaraensis NBRC 13819 = DSM 40847]|uniref:NUDIX hydrolase n=1 Tax=Streptomyces mobaraensis (strain ATCC 29032 / DSM 40847 / JCM 4168 / NBRC 13819 / NCIMB 11159 / IPCR 16-22) TaxID=1223523 RepID=M3B4K8_STRM1|nr:NUDIX hydrolase [Streptomyces mobaraensis NBRC 13819 = DSM 40847]